MNIMNTGIAAIISSLIGYGLFAYKRNTDDTTVPGESNNENNQSSEETASPSATTDARRLRSMYFGSELDGGVYDPLYDYSAENGEKLYFQRQFIDNITTNEERVRTLRARIIAPFVTSELAGEDDTFIGTDAKDRNGYCNGLWLYRNGHETIQISDESIFARKLAKGNVRNVSFFLEIFNPCKQDVIVETIGVDNIFVGSNRCQMVHLTSDPKNLGKVPTDLYSGNRAWRRSVYQNATDNALENEFNEGRSEVNVLRDNYRKVIHTGNQPYFAARELQIETLKSNATQQCKWKPCEYPYDMREGFLALVSKSGKQNPYNIFDGLQKYGICQEVFNYEKSNFNYDNRCVVPALGSIIVKMVMPLADMESSTVSFVKGTDIYRLHTSGSDNGTFDELRTNNHYWYSIFPYAQGILSDSRQTFQNGVSRVTEDEEFGRRELYFKNDFYDGVRGYCVFDIKPAPELANRNLSMKLTLYGDHKDLHPNNDPVISGGSNSNGNAIEVKVIATPIDPNDMDWRNSYYGTGPDERLSAQDQLNLYLAKTGSEIGEYFDPSINN